MFALAAGHRRVCQLLGFERASSVRRILAPDEQRLATLDVALFEQLARTVDAHNINPQ
jgi:hypothetical protein